MGVIHQLDSMTTGHQVRTFLALRRVVILLLFSLATSVPLCSADTHEGYFSPVYAPDGKEVYFIVRKTGGITWGLGMEFFTPPAHAFVLSDQFSLKKLRVQTGDIQTVKDWPSSPLTRHHIEEYRGRIFFIPQTQLRFTSHQQLEYKIGVPSPNITNFTRRTFWVTRVWDETHQRMVEDDVWHESGDATYGYDERPLFGNWEVIAVPGRESYPAAIVAYNHVTSSVRVLIKNREFAHLYPSGVGLSTLAGFSKRTMIERDEKIATTHQELVERFQGEGLREGEAMLKVNKEMERLGYYPKTPTITARVLSQSEEEALSNTGPSPILSIAPEEMRSGIFQDIEEAINNPGTPMDKDFTPYVIHRDYKNSEKLNVFLASGGSTFYIRYDGHAYELKINRQESSQ